MTGESGALVRLLGMRLAPALVLAGLLTAVLRPGLGGGLAGGALAAGGLAVFAVVFGADRLARALSPRLLVGVIAIGAVGLFGTAATPAGVLPDAWRAGVVGAAAFLASAGLATLACLLLAGRAGEIMLEPGEPQ